MTPTVRSTAQPRGERVGCCKWARVRHDHHRRQMVAPDPAGPLDPGLQETVSVKFWVAVPEALLAVMVMG